MTAVNKIMEAIRAEKTPAQGTVRDALAEIEALQARYRKTIADSLDLVDDLVTLAEMRGRIIGMDAAWTIQRGLERTLNLHVAEAHPEQISDDHAPSLCSVCEDKPARIWVNAVGYCKRCAEERGVRVHGKIT